MIILVCLRNASNTSVSAAPHAIECMLVHVYSSVIYIGTRVYCVQFMKEEMELVQHMEQSEPRDTHQYITQLENLLLAKSESIDALQEVLLGFRAFRENDTTGR